jgi:ABC-2 type transport system permease protein
MSRSDLRRVGAAIFAVLRRDLQMTLTYRFTLVSQWTGMFFTLTLFHFVSQLVRVREFASPEAYYAFAVVGLVILQMLNSTLQGPPGALRSEMIAGTFERLVLSPLGATRALFAAMLFPFVMAVLSGFVMLGFAAAAFGLPLRWSTAGLALPAAMLGALAFAPFGVALVALTILFKQANAGTTFIVAGISLVSGLYFPVSLLPGWVRWTAYVQPFTPSAEILRSVLVGTPLREPLAIELTKIIGFTAVLFPLSVLALRSALHASQRRGTIIEY